jgi:hypothetical protein
VAVRFRPRDSISTTEITAYGHPPRCRHPSAGYLSGETILSVIEGSLWFVQRYYSRRCGGTSAMTRCAHSARTLRRSRWQRQSESEIFFEALGRNDAAPAVSARLP